MKVVQIYAFLDPGSTVSFCSDGLMEELDFHGRKVEITLSTMGTMESHLVKGLEICDLESNNIISLPHVYTKDNISVSKAYMPKQRDIERWSHLAEVKIPSAEVEITMLIGNNVPDAYAPLDVKVGPRGSPHAVKTLLGWIVCNLTSKRASGELSVNKVDIIAMHERKNLKSLDSLVRESINYDFPERAIDHKRELSRENKEFMEKTSESIKFKDGHYEIGMPFRDENVKLPDNRECVLMRDVY